MSGFCKISGHLYKIKNQNGLNNALYDYFGLNDKETGRYSKSEVRSMVQNAPPSFPTCMIIIDITFECNKIYLEFFDIEEAINMDYC